jgi:hypothetical protein
MQLVNQGNPLGGGHQIALVASQVAVLQQSFNDGRPRRRRAQTALAHRFTQFFVIHQLARPLHAR